MLVLLKQEYVVAVSPPKPDVFSSRGGLLFFFGILPTASSGGERVRTLPRYLGIPAHTGASLLREGQQHGTPALLIEATFPTIVHCSGQLTQLNPLAFPQSTN